ncbi:hypothetical protein F5884DRAFT_858077 [Xylogone sp. PMI_703]|nr:hypothetical protein F5884DRAFT_858077 [Xylogone sp. PMI_703]
MASRGIELDSYVKDDDDDELEPFISRTEYVERKYNVNEFSNRPLNNTLPPRQGFGLYRFIRYTGLNVYRRIFTAVLIINGFIAYHVITKKRRSKYSPLLVDISTVASLNLMLAVLIRQDYVLNILFKICWCVPFWTPLRIRRSLAKIYEFGGLHSGTAVCSLLWFIMLTVVLTWEWMSIRIRDPFVIFSSYTIAALLFAMVVSAYPEIRIVWHNTFEVLHRFGGWIILTLFFPELWLFTRALGHQAGPLSPGAILHKLPAFWILCFTTFHVALPWMRLRRLQTKTEHLGVGVHAIRLHFKEKVPHCVVYRISDSPLKEWHSFACIPNPDKTGSSIIVSNAGDWTLKMVNNPKKYYYTRGIPTVGVLCMARIFRKVIIVTTGSGIGPCLGTMMFIPKTVCRIIWSTPTPRLTFGDELVDNVFGVDPKAVIVDTEKEGRLDLVVLAYNLYRETGAEAVFCVSNRKVTKHVVYELECRGIPAFGPVWDS